MVYFVGLWLLPNDFNFGFNGETNFLAETILEIFGKIIFLIIIY
jgi:hypothetical protein